MVPVVVTGLPRSGTSWVAKALSFAAGYTYYREPDNFGFVPKAEPGFRWAYLRAGDNAASPLARQLERALRGEERHPAVMTEDAGPLLGRLPGALRYHVGRRLPSLYLPRRGVLVKLVFSNLALDWLAADEEVRLVPVLRHPCGTYLSWSRAGWEPNPTRLLEDDRLVADHLSPYVDAISTARSYWERAGAEWGALATVLANQAETHPGWRVVQHEWLCSAPMRHFEMLYAALGLRWPVAAADFVRDNDRGGDDDRKSLRRSASAEIDKWKRALDPADVAACRRVVERFELAWYPGFEPVASTPAWASGSVA